MAQFPVGTQVSQVWPGGGPVLFANQDLVNPVTIGKTPNITQDAGNTDVIPPLGSIAYLAGPARYAVAPNGTAALLAIDGGTSWAPSPADVALQISALGLARDTTVAGVPAGIQEMGAPPFVPNLESQFTLNQGPTTPAAFYTFPANGRLWGGSLAFAMATNQSAGGGTHQGYARILTGSGTGVGLVEANTGGPSSADSNTVPLLGGGFPVLSGDTLKIDVNNGVTMGTDGVMRASALVWVSFP